MKRIDNDDDDLGDGAYGGGGGGGEEEEIMMNMTMTMEKNKNDLTRYKPEAKDFVLSPQSSERLIAFASSERKAAIRKR